MHRRYHRRLAITFSTAALLPASAPALAQGFDYRMVALTDQLAPGVPGMEFNTFRPPTSFDVYAAPVINAAGDLAFWANLNPVGGGSTGNAVFFEQDGVITPLAVAGQSIPTLAGATYDTVLGRRLIIDHAGGVAFNIQYDHADGSGQAIMVGGAVPLRTAVHTGQTVPQDDPLSLVFGWEFDSIGFGINFLNPYNGEEFAYNANSVAFQASIQNPDGPGNLQGIWVERPSSATPNGLELVARSGADTDFNPQDRLVLSGYGEVGFITGVSPEDAGAFTAFATYTADISYIAQTGSEAGGDTTFTGFSGNPAMNNAGQGAFVARFNDLPASDSGIFKSNDPNGIIATEGIIANGTPDLSGDGFSDFVFRDFGNASEPLINGNGNVVFWARASTPDNSMSFTGLWSDRTGNLTSLDPVIMTGQQVPGLEEGTTFSNIALGNIDNVVINANDDVAFFAQFTRPDSSLDAGLFAEVDGQLELIAATGELWQMPDGSTRTITGISFLGGSGNQDGRPSGFSDHGEIAFRLDFNGGSSGLFVVNTLDFLAGDLNGDGFVGVEDLDILLANWGSSVPTSNLTLGDASGDGFVNQVDLDIVLNHWGDGVPPANVPEPGGAALLTLGTLALLRRRRRPSR
ncbi:MAG: choice-of-anchor tandem repeat NxxGxxAF-containing protein [Phycisphaerales bacterium JB063]